MEEGSKLQRWLPIESNPEVMNKFLHNCGLPADKWAITDVYGLDEALLAMLPQPVLSLMLLFPINEKYKEHCCNQEEALKITTQVKHHSRSDMGYIFKILPPQFRGPARTSYSLYY